jgi:hypothetical protein
VAVLRILGSAGCVMAAAGICYLAPPTPATPARNELLRLCAKGMVRAMGFTVHVKGWEHCRAAAGGGGAYLVVANHMTFLDPFFIGGLLGPLAPVMRADILGWPFFGAVARALQGVPVDRAKKGGQGVTAAIQARSEGRKRFYPVVIFLRRGRAAQAASSSTSRPVPSFPACRSAPCCSAWDSSLRSSPCLRASRFSVGMHTRRAGKDCFVRG